MVSLNKLQQQDTFSGRSSILHDLDGRVKLIAMILIIVFAVSTNNFLIFLILELYLIALILISKIPFKDAMLKVLVILPFGLFIAIFQPFVHPGHVIYALPLGINVTTEGLLFGELLTARFFISVTSIVLFSFITPMQEVAQSMRQLGMPNEFAMIFSLFVRFIFMFYDQLISIRRAQASRGFSVHSKKTSYKWKVKQVGYLFLMMFLRSYEQGEKVFNSMTSRGYSMDSVIYNSSNGLSRNSILYLVGTILFICLLEGLMIMGII